MYNIFIFNFTFKCNFKCNYHVYKFYVVILSLVLARETTNMYNKFIFNFTFKCNF